MPRSMPFKARAGLLVVLLAGFALDAHAQALDSSGVMDDMLREFSGEASTWAGAVQTRAEWLFWTLVLLSMVWTFGTMAIVARAGFDAVIAELTKFTIVTGFFWWILINGPRFAKSIIDSMRRIAGEASRVGDGTLSPSGVVDVGFAIFGRVVDKSSVLSPVDSSMGILMALGILLMLLLTAINMLLLLISAWMLTYAGIFYLGFGGGRWTTDIALGFYRTVLKLAMELYAMVLLVGIGQALIDKYYLRMGQSTSLKDMAVLLFVAVATLILSGRVPSLISSVVSGGPVGGSGVGNLGTGSVMAAASMATAAATMGAALAVAGAANLAGGAKAVMEAFKAAGDGASGGGSASDMSGGLLPGGGGGGDDTGAGGESGGPLGNGGGGGHPGAGGNSFAEAAGFEGPSGGGSSFTAGSSRGATQGRQPKGFGERFDAMSKTLSEAAVRAAQDRKDAVVAAARQRVAETPGARLAETIKARNTPPAPAPAQTAAPTFDDDSLSGDPQRPDPDSVDGDDMFDDKRGG